jgi:hypothetical protein
MMPPRRRRSAIPLTGYVAEPEGGAGQVLESAVDGLGRAGADGGGQDRGGACRGRGAVTSFWYGRSLRRLPTQATSDPMFERVGAWLHSVDHSVALVCCTVSDDSTRHGPQ